MWITEPDFFFEKSPYGKNGQKWSKNEKSQEVYENYINDFSEKNIILVRWAILGSKMVWLHDSGFTLRFFFFNLAQ